MTYATSESDVTSIYQSSSYPSPNPNVYYVQSPGYSQDEVDKGSRTASVQASPVGYNSSSMESPLRSSFERSSNPRSSSASRISGNWRYWRANRKRSGKAWQEMYCDTIREDGINYDDDDDRGEDDQRDGILFHCLMIIIAAAVVFAAVCFIIWAASRPYKPQITMKSLTFHNFYVGEGSDTTGVPTKFLTVNCTATISIHNPAKFFGIYVSSSLVNLTYLDITVAIGELKKHYQPKTSSRVISFNLDGHRVPLYGAGGIFDDSKEVPLKLDMEIQSCGNLVGWLVKTKHRRHISCSLVIHFKGTTKDITFHPHSCTYD